MSATKPDRPLDGHRYEIVFGQLERSWEVDVRSNSARPLKVGETYTFGRSEGFYDVIVAEVATTRDGGVERPLQGHRPPADLMRCALRALGAHQRR